MMRRPTLILSLLALATVAGAESPTAVGALPGWMTGCWAEEAGAKWTEECWMEPRGGIMLGASRSGSGDTLREWEATQIMTGPTGKLGYWASPGGGSWVFFAMVSQGKQEIVFEAPSHDYPQRIRYWRDGADLLAEISDIAGARAARWRYHPER